MPTEDELADALKATLDEIEARIEARPTGALQTRLKRAAAVAHRALYVLKLEAVDQGIIQPMSGGDPDKP